MTRPVDNSTTSRTGTIARLLIASLATIFTGTSLLASVPSITNLQIQNGTVVVSWQGGGTTNQVQSATSPSGPWQDVDLPTTASAVTNILTAPSAFYRVVNLGANAAAANDRVAPAAPTGFSGAAGGCDQISLSWNAATDANPSSGIKEYLLYRNGVFLMQIPSSGSSTYTASDLGLNGGTAYTYSVLAVDNAGHWSSRANATATTAVCKPKPDTTPPVVSISTPATGASVSGRVQITAIASDDTGVTSVEFYVDNSAGGWTLLGTQSGTGKGPANYAFTCDTSTLSNGPHSLYCKAYDAAGNATASATVQVAVNNTVVTGGTFQWVKTMLSQNGNATVTGVASDSAGNIIAVGFFNGSADFGLGPIASILGVSVTDAFVVKYSPQGALIWFKRLGGVGNDAAKSVAIDSQNNIIVVGNFQSSVDFGGGILTAVSSIEMFVAKYNSNGTYLWANHYSGLTSDVGATVAVDGSDNVVVLADCGYNANFGGISLSPAGGAADIDGAVGKLSGVTGATMWARRFGGVNWENARAVAVDRSGDVVVTGYFQTSTDLGGGTLIGGGSYDIFLAKYSGVDGSYRWGKVFGGPGGDYGYGVTTDPTTGNVVLTGQFSGSINFGGGNLTTSGSGGIFMAGFDGSGNYLLAVATGGSGDSGAAVKIDGSGNLALTGRASSGIYFGGTQSFLSNGQANGFTASFKISGNTAPTYRWTKYYGPGTDGASVGNAIALDPSGQVLMGGSFMATIDFGGGPITAGMAGYSSGYLVKYAQ
jgi:hypothetical protein